MRELRASRALTQRPDSGCGRLQALVDSNKPPRVELHSRDLKTDPGGVRGSSGRNEDVATGAQLLAGSRLDPHGHFLAGSTFHRQRLGEKADLDPFTFQKFQKLLADTRVLATQQMLPAVDQ